MSKKTAVLGAALLAIVVVIVVAVLAIGGDEEAEANTDVAFVAEMAPHHESAIEMARIAQERAQHPEIAELADEIVATQSSEIETLDAIAGRLGSTGGDESLGLSEDAMGMMGDTASLQTAEPFDRAFIDMMVPHHQGAILMARVELVDGADDEAKALAETIIATQSGEIEEMNAWREEWYGAPSPAGGIPEEGEAAAAHGEAHGTGY